MNTKTLPTNQFDAGTKPALARGDYAGAAIDSDEELGSLLCAFADEGTLHREHLLFICHPANAPFYRGLRDTCRDPRGDPHAWRLHTYGRGGKPFDAARTLRTLRAARDAALAGGASGVRAVLDMRWVREHPDGPAALEDFSREAAAILLEDDCLLLAIYDRRIFPAAALLQILSFHPRFIRASKARHNPFFCAWDDPLGRRRADALLECLLGQLEASPDHELTSLQSLDSKGTRHTLEAMIDSMAYGLTVVDAVGRMILVNKTGREIMGYGRINLPLAERVRVYGNYLPDGVTHYAIQDLPVSRALRGEEVNPMEICVRNEHQPAGVIVSSTARPIRDRGGKVIGAVLVYRDITAEKQAAAEKAKLEAAMHRSQKLESLGLLAGGIAHDFNNLLMGVLGNLGLAQTALDNRPELEERLEHSRLAAARLADLTSQLLAYAGSGAFSRTLLSLPALVREMEALLRTVVSKKAKVTVDAEESCPVIHADGTHLRQIIMNLITNASDALGGGAGEIRVRAGALEADRAYLDQTYLADRVRPGRFAFLEVSDTGCGVDPAVLARIFDPFFTTKPRGHGLGLATVLGLVRRHQGTLLVESTPGRGSTFRVLFPAAGPAAPAAEAIKEGPAPQPSHGTILVIDDEPSVRNVVQAILEKSGLAVIAAESGREGIEIFSRERSGIAAVVLDMTMPDMHGTEVLRRLREIRPGVKVLVSSGYSEQGMREIFTDNAADAFLQKPYSPRRLMEKMQQVLAGRPAGAP